MGTKAYSGIKKDLRVGIRKIDRRKLGAREADILTEVSTGDVLVGFLCSARSTQRMLRIASDRVRARKSADEQYELKRRVARMRTKGLLEILETKDGTTVRISEKGKGELELHTVHRTDVKEWDGKWRMVLFDIPDTNESLRDELRATLRIVGFLRVQNSVYMFPYPVPTLENEIRKNALPASQLMWSVVEVTTDERALKKHFKLS